MPNDVLNTFISKAQKSKIAVVVPLFGYWSDMKSQQLNEETLKYSLDRVYSNVHQLYVVYVAEEARLSDAVANNLIARSRGGNVKGVAMAKGSTYGDYLHAGIDAAIEMGTDYVVVLNPWGIIQFGGIDMMVERINRDDARIVSGFDVRGAVDPANFDKHNFSFPQETRGIDTNFFGMRRGTAEMIDFDQTFKTHSFIGRDAWQVVFSKGAESIITQKIPFFSFEVDWAEFESREAFEEDKRHFEQKWRFGLDDVKYGK